ncbi:hypothetical protein ACFPFX_09210 [Streptomyces mauvecolor]|uniref:Uncharacterized protein n=1 Tax=Streptomyces mauvecolor TaxID=58345 RepID=A0ABV9UK09_9ACTN
MSDTAPEAKGPAPIKLPAEQTEAKWVTVHAGLKTAEGTAAELTPTTDVNPEDIGTLSIEYRDGQPVVVVSGGSTIPAGLTVVDGSRQPVAKYQVGPFALFEIPRDESTQRR